VEGCTEAELLAQLNLPKGRLQQALKIISLETPAPIGKQGSRWQRLPASLQPQFWERVERLTELREVEAAQMQAYVELPFGERMAFLIEALSSLAFTLAVSSTTVNLSVAPQPSRSF
jgi:ATP-dependent DNA helicase RecQ